MDTLLPKELDQALCQVRDSSEPTRARQEAECYRHEGMYCLAQVSSETARAGLAEIGRLVVERMSY